MLLLPELNQVITASRDEAFDIVGFLSRRLVDQAAWNHSGTPAHGVTADLQETQHCIHKQAPVEALETTHTCGFYSRCVRC